MASDIMTPHARHENATTLASILGLDIDKAAELLEIDTAITIDTDDSIATLIATEIAELLSRTVRRASLCLTEGNLAAEVIIGNAQPRTSAKKVYTSVYSDRAIISSQPNAIKECSHIPRILGLLIACYTSAAVLHHTLDDHLNFGLQDPFVIPFDQLGVDLSTLEQPIYLEKTFMAGAGAIGNGFLKAARLLNLHGKLIIADDDKVSDGNLNRQIWFNTDDINHYKADRLATKAQPFFSSLELIPRPSRLQDLPEKSSDPWLRRLIVAVDSRRARRKLQNEFPGEVFDASTTDIREIVLHYHRQPAASACLSCIYEADNEEITREAHIAELLGVSVDDVRSERISEKAADIIATKYPALVKDKLVGTAYDTLFKQLCAEGSLTTPAGRTVIAPFAFVSVLAGTYLALEIVRRLGNGNSDTNFNYWRLSPWHPPFARRRILRTRQFNCEFCGDAILLEVNEALWQ